MRLAVFLLALYLITDFSDPGLPGAFNFNPDDSVEVVRVEKVVTSLAPLPAVTPFRSAAVLIARDARVHKAAVVMPGTVTAQRSPTILLRPPLRHVAPEDAPAASPRA